MMVAYEEATTNAVAAAAIIRRVAALSGIAGRKAVDGGVTSQGKTATPQPGNCLRCR